MLKKKNSARAIGALTIISVLMLMLAPVAYATIVNIASFADFPAYPYNTTGYKVGGAFVGCGPTTGAMILGYFEHYFGATGLLVTPGAGVNEGVDTAWVLHSSAYMNTGTNGYGSSTLIRPGLEGYAASRGFEVDVLVHGPPGDTSPGGNWYDWFEPDASYGPYNDAWTDDADFWIVTGPIETDASGNPLNIYDPDIKIDADKFCDWAEPKLAAGIAIMLTIDTAGNYDVYGDHWVPCVGVDKALGVYYWYDTYSTSVQSSTVQHCTDGTYGINCVRTVEFIPEEIEPEDPVAIFTETASTVEIGEIINFDASASYDDGAIVSYEWDWETDGIIDDVGVTASHAYSLAGIYTVTLTVTDDDGNTDTATATKTVYDEICPVIPEVPLGTIVISASMIIALAAYFAMPRLRRKSEYIKP